MLTIIALVIALLFLAAAIVDIAEVGAFAWWSRRRRRRGPAAVGAQTIVGRRGIALARLDPAGVGTVGQVRVEGEIWGARSRVPIDPGAAVVVNAVDGLVLEVVPEPYE